MNKPVAQDIPSVLRRRYKEYRNEGYNDESLRCLNRAADRIEALERELAEANAYARDRSVALQQADSDNERLEARVAELEAQARAFLTADYNIRPHDWLDARRALVAALETACEHVWNEPDVILGGIVCRKCGTVRFAGTEDKP